MGMTLIDLYLDGPSVDDMTGPLVVPVTDEGPQAATTTEAVESTVEEGPRGTSYPRCADGNGTLTHLFFSDDEFDIARAKAICSKCGLADACLTGALDRAEPFGVWGGSLLVDGVIVEMKRGRGRPPKQPRPPLVVDEVPIPPHLVA
jgi:WhiB family redox-sensing transcriptional regulator